MHARCMCTHLYSRTRVLHTVGLRIQQEAQLSPRDRAMRRVN